MALKEKVERNKFFKQSKSIVTEIEKNNAMQTQLKDMMASKKDSEKTVTALQLRSDKWYDFQLQEQITATENRVKFLKKENSQITKKIAIRNQKMLKSLEKADIHRKLDLEEIEKKNLLSTPTINTKRQGFNS
tara:strand:+ start:116 stop:514 length:399 start_codon:yes stop_codon:yes gene_type:complete